MTGHVQLVVKKKKGIWTKLHLWNEKKSKFSDPVQ